MKVVIMSTVDAVSVYIITSVLCILSRLSMHNCCSQLVSSSSFTVQTIFSLKTVQMQQLHY